MTHKVISRTPPNFSLFRQIRFAKRVYSVDMIYLFATIALLKFTTSPLSKR